jgi:hypothetical protein
MLGAQEKGPGDYPDPLDWWRRRLPFPCRTTLHTVL